MLQGLFTNTAQFLSIMRSPLKPLPMYSVSVPPDPVTNASGRWDFSSAADVYADLWTTNVSDGDAVDRVRDLSGNGSPLVTTGSGSAVTYDAAAGGVRFHKGAHLQSNVTVRYEDAYIVVSEASADISAAPLLSSLAAQAYYTHITPEGGLSIDGYSSRSQGSASIGTQPLSPSNNTGTDYTPAALGMSLIQTSAPVVISTRIPERSFCRDVGQLEASSVQLFDGVLHEIVLYDRQLPEPERLSLVDYLTKKHGAVHP